MASLIGAWTSHNALQASRPARRGRRPDVNSRPARLVLPFRMLVFRQLFDPTSSTYTYLLGCSVTREALLIDPVFEQVRRDGALIGELGLQLTWTLDTHVHADHVTGAWLLKQKLGSRIALSAAAGAWACIPMPPIATNAASIRRWRRRRSKWQRA